MTHHCHARGCEVAVRPELLMCRRHWFQVPRRVAMAVYRAYRPGQCDDKRPSAEWHVAADAAIGFVAANEHYPVRDEEAAALGTLGYTRTGNESFKRTGTG